MTYFAFKECRMNRFRSKYDVYDREEYIVVAATHDTSYQNDAGGIKASSRWLGEATPSGHDV